MVDDTATDERTIPSILPQPTIVGAKPYHYVRYEQVEQAFFPNSLKPQTLCWVLLSKGKNKPAQMTERARVLSSECGEGNRVKVQYPLGSTYHVRRPRLIPVLEENERIIIVASETPEYRRAAVVHTT